MTDAVSAPETPITPALGAPPAAPVTPPAAVVPPVVAPTVLPLDEPAAEVPAEITFDPTGDPALDVALGFMGKMGLDGKHPAMVAAGKGEFGLLKAHLATMGDKARGWEQMVALGEDAFKRQATAATELQTKVTAIVHEVAGGEQQWQTIFEWAKANADADEKAEINKLFDSGPMGARAAARLLTDAYGSATGTVVNPKNATRQGATNVVASGNGPLSPSEYAVAARELSRKLGNRMDASPEYAALRGRLAAYRG